MNIRHALFRVHYKKYGATVEHDLKVNKFKWFNMKFNRA